MRLDAYNIPSWSYGSNGLFLAEKDAFYYWPCNCLERFMWWSISVETCISSDPNDFLLILPLYFDALRHGTPNKYSPTLSWAFPAQNGKSPFFSRSLKSLATKIDFYVLEHSNGIFERLAWLLHHTTVILQFKPQTDSKFGKPGEVVREMGLSQLMSEDGDSQQNLALPHG